MGSFKDASGKTWSVPITVGSVQRCRSEAEVDLLDGGQCLIEMGGDPIKMAQALYCLAQPRPDSAEAFYAALDGPAIKSGMDALVSSLMTFYEASRPKMAAALSALMETWAASEAEQTKVVEEELKGPEVNRALEKDMQAIRTQVRDALASGSSSTG